MIWQAALLQQSLCSRRLQRRKLQRLFIVLSYQKNNRAIAKVANAIKKHHWTIKLHAAKLALNKRSIC